MEHKYAQVRMGLVAALALTSCAHGKPLQVSDADFGRLSPQQTGPVHEARQVQQTAREEIARANLGVQQAQNELRMAEADRAAADADAQRAKAVADAADQNRIPTALQRASQLTDEAQLHRRSADMHAEWATKLIEARQAQVGAAQRHLDLAQAQVDYSRLVALQQASIPAATKYDPREFQARVEDARNQFQEAQAKANQLGGEAMASRHAYEAAHQQFQARIGARPGVSGQDSSGTGSSDQGTRSAQDHW